MKISFFTAVLLILSLLPVVSHTDFQVVKTIHVRKIHSKKTKQPNNEFRKGPYLIYTDDSSSMQVLWQSYGTTFRSSVEWGTTTEYGFSSGSLKSLDKGENGHRYRYTIGKLKSNTVYYYQVKLDSRSQSGSFITAPSETADEVVFYAYGDTRSNSLLHNFVMKAILDDINQSPADRQTLLLHTADWTNNSTEYDWDNSFFNSKYTSIREVLRRVAVMGARGNHEHSGNVFMKYWPFHDTKFYYSFDYGPVHITVIDQFIKHSPGSEQYSWIENDLATTDKAIKIILYHMPAWGGGPHLNDKHAQELHHTLFLKYGVSMVIGGHNHNYARCTVDGITHCTLGGGGAPAYNVDINMPHMVAGAKVNHFARIEVSGNKLDVTIIDKKGIVIDQFIQTVTESR